MSLMSKMEHSPASGWLEYLLNLLQTQFAYVENKAVFLIAGTSLLLGSTVTLALKSFRCKGVGAADALLQCATPSIPLVVFCISGALTLASLLFALLSVRTSPGVRQLKPRKSLLFFSYIGSIDQATYKLEFLQATNDDFIEDALTAISLQSAWLKTKYKYVDYAVRSAVISLFFLSFGIAAALADVDHLRPELNVCDKK